MGYAGCSLYAFNFRYFSISGPAHLFQWFWGGLVFDTVAILYVNVSVYRSGNSSLSRSGIKNGMRSYFLSLFVVTNSVALAANFTDIFYYPFTLTRTTASVFRQFSNESNLGTLFSRFLVDYWYGTLIIYCTGCRAYILHKKNKA